MRERTGGVIIGAALALGMCALALAIAADPIDAIDDELSLIAPPAARPGVLLPLRALLYRGLRSPEGPQLRASAVRVALIDHAGHELAAAWLHAGFGGSLEGAIALPASAGGRLRLIADARPGGVLATAERGLALGNADDAGATASEPRAARAAELAPGMPIRVAGASCVPEHPCDVFVYVGAEVTGMRLIETESVTYAPGSPAFAPSRAQLVELRVITHGTEAHARLQLENSSGLSLDERPRREAWVRLPVALGMSALEEQPRLLVAPARPAIALRGGERGCIVDAFRDRRWLRTGSLDPCLGPHAVPFAALPAGLWRLQLRRDPFGSDSAGLASVYVREPGESPATTLSRLAAAAAQREPGDPLVRAVLLDPVAHVASFEPVAGYLLALLDAGAIALPPAISGRAAALRAALQARADSRAALLLALGLCALAVCALVLQRGLRASAVADQLMAAAGEDARAAARSRRRRFWRVVATVCSLLAAFSSIAAYIVARGRGM